MKAEARNRDGLQGTALPPMRLPKRSFKGAIISFVVMVLIPAALAAVYFYVFAADRYVSDFRYAVRGGAMLQEGEQGSGKFGSGAAIAAAADSFILEDYLRSTAALREVEERLPIREMLGRDGNDPLRAYNPDAPVEELIDFWNGAVYVRFDVITGITTVEVSLYRPEDSEAVAEVLVELLDRLVDQLSEKARNEMLAYIAGEYTIADERVKGKLDEIEAFRRENNLVSPEETAELGSSVIAQLTSDLTELSVQRRTLLENVPNSPKIPRISEQILSLQQQLAAERAAIGGSGTDSALPVQLSIYERLQSEYQIALDSFIATLALRQEAQAAATLSAAQLVVFVPPRPAELATEPVRWLELLKITAVVFLVWLSSRILLASFRAP